MKKKIYIVIYLLVCVVSIYADDISKPSTLEGEGTSANPYLITTADELQWFAQQSNVIDGSAHKNFSLCAKLMNDIYYNGSNKVLNDDGSLVSDVGSLKIWTPIAWSDSGEPKEFLGTFDGNGYTIYGLYIANTGNLPKGFVGYLGGKTVDNIVYSGIVKNLIIKDSYFSANGDVGGICGQNNDGKVICCASYATVRRPDTSEYGNYGVGGICGASYGGVIRNSYCRSLKIDGYNRGAIIGCTNTTDIPSVISCFGGEITDRHYSLVGGNGAAKYDDESSSTTKRRYVTTWSEANVSDFRFSIGEISYRLNVKRVELDNSNGTTSLEWGQTLYAYGDTTSIDAYPTLRDSLAITRGSGKELMHRKMFYHPHTVADVSGMVQADDYITRWYPVDFTFEGNDIKAHTITGLDLDEDPQGRVLATDAGAQSGFKGKPVIIYNHSTSSSLSFLPPVHTETRWVDDDAISQNYKEETLTINTYPYYNTVPGDWLNAIYSGKITKDAKAGYYSYALQNTGGKRGFHVIDGDTYIYDSFYRCYLSVSKSAASLAKDAFYIEFGGTTSIDNNIVNTDSKNNDRIYNLMGQLIANPRKIISGSSRIYIMNGRKYVAR